MFTDLTTNGLSKQGDSSYSVAIASLHYPLFKLCEDTHTMIPVISGTIASQAVDVGDTINPFNAVSIIDANDFVTDVSLTITSIDSNGNPTDANGTLSILAADLGNDKFTETSPGVYVLTNGNPPGPSSTVPFFQPQLANITFIPTGAATTKFSLAVLDGDGEHQTDTTTTMTASGATASTNSAAPFDTSASTSSAATTDTPTDTGSTTSAATSTDTSSVTSTKATTLAGFVGSNVTKTLIYDSQLVIHHPHRFHGQVDLRSGDIDLNSLAQADSYSFRSDMLTIYASNGKVLDKLRLTCDSSAFSVEKTAIGVSIYTADDTLHSSTGTLLPLNN
jgi:hypothetical protein